jgi:hypothetical protein
MAVGVKSVVPSTGGGAGVKVGWVLSSAREGWIWIWGGGAVAWPTGCGGGAGSSPVSEGQSESETYEHPLNRMTAAPTIAARAVANAMEETPTR